MVQAQLLDDAGGDGIALHDTYLGFEFCIEIEPNGHDNLFEAEVIVSVEVEKDTSGGFITFGKNKRHCGYDD